MFYNKNKILPLYVVNSRVLMYKYIYITTAKRWRCKCKSDGRWGTKTARLETCVRGSTPTVEPGNRPKMKRKRYDILTNRTVRLKCVAEGAGERNEKNGRQTSGTVCGRTVREERRELGIRQTQLESRCF